MRIFRPVMHTDTLRVGILQEYINKTKYYFNTCTMRLLLFCTMTNKYTIISQIITLLHVSTLSCHLQGACNQYLAKLHKYIPGQHDSSINIQTVYTATTQTDFIRIVAAK
jgi:hypothetical protein